MNTAETIGAVAALAAAAGGATAWIHGLLSKRFDKLDGRFDKLEEDFDEQMREQRAYVDKKDAEIMSAVRQGFEEARAASEERQRHTEALFREAFAPKVDVAVLEHRVASLEHRSRRPRSDTPPRAPSAPGSPSRDT